MSNLARVSQREKTAKIADRKAKREAQKARQSVSRQRVNAEQHATNHAGTAAAAAAATAAAVPLPIREVQVILLKTMPQVVLPLKLMAQVVSSVPSTS